MTFSPFAHIYFIGKKCLTKIDPWLLLGLSLLALMSELSLYSAQQDTHRLLCLNQGLRFLLGVILYIGCAQIPTRFIQHYSPYLYTLTLGLLLLVLVMGTVGKGAQRWLDLGIIRLQPSEFMKASVPMMMAWYWHRQAHPPQIKPILISLILIGIPTALIIKQPDLGTGLILASCGLSVLYLAGISWRYIAASLVALATSLPLIWQHLHLYQKQRVLTYLMPERDPLGAGYHIIQAKIAIGSGGLWGKGWLHGTQSHLHFLPEQTTDFIFALWAEEFGLIGCLILIAVLVGLSLRMLWLAHHSHSSFSQLLSGSFACLFTLSYCINIGMVCGLLPVVGVPLPWVSYGGSAILLIAVILGLSNAMNYKKHIQQSL